MHIKIDMEGVKAISASGLSFGCNNYIWMDWMKYILKRTFLNRIEVFVEDERFDNNDPADIKKYKYIREATSFEIDEFIKNEK